MSKERTYPVDFTEIEINELFRVLRFLICGSGDEEGTDWGRVEEALDNIADVHREIHGP